MTAITQKSTSFLVALGIFSVLAACLFSVSSAFSMDKNQQGNMEGCVFTGNTALCNMSVTEDIAQWQNLFTAIPQKSFDLLIALSLAIIAFLVGNKLARSPDGYQSSRQRCYAKQFSTLGIATPLRLAFSRGILHPKIYNLILS